MAGDTFFQTYDHKVSKNFDYLISSQLKVKNKVLHFDSVLEYHDHMYKFTINTTDEKTKKTISLSKEISVTECYDDKGYLHRYVLVPFLDEAIARFEEFFTSKSK